MPVPGSGEITLGKIGKELRSTGTGDDYDNGPDTANATSLEDASDGTIDTINTGNDASDRPDGVDPHAMSEFYNYDHNVSSFSLGTELWSFDDQFGSNGSTFANVAWNPAGTHSGWDNGVSCVAPTTVGKISVQQWESEGSGNQRDWYIDSNQTGSPNTGPNGAANANGTHNTADNTRYLYTEVSSSNHAKYHVCRTPGHNYYAAMTSVSYNLKIHFREHSYGSNMGNLRVYADTSSTSNHANATLLQTYSGASDSSRSDSWNTRSFIANEMRNDAVWYIYFVSNAATGYRGDRSIDRVGVNEHSAAP